MSLVPRQLHSYFRPPTSDLGVPPFDIRRSAFGVCSALAFSLWNFEVTFALMKLQDVLLMLNQLERDGVIERYAIGGAVASTFYLEPVSTLDVDVFIGFKLEGESVIVSPAPIFDYLKKFGCRMEGEHIIISDWPVQFLPANGPLLEEALANAAEVDVEGNRARVFGAEYLAAIALQTGRAKDKARLLQFVEAGWLATAAFEELIVRHGLKEKWKKFSRQFLDS